MNRSRIVLASSNAGKLREICAALDDPALELVTQGSLGVSDAEETGLSFVENAIIKARHASLATGLPSLADDSGLEVDALLGKPGIHSARFAGLSGPQADPANNSKLLAELASVPDQQRTARFQCVIVYLRHAADPTPLICQGTWEGRILHEPRGDNGFGYDPLFLVPTHGCTSAELEPAVKNQLSHRGQALRKLQACWRSRP